MTAERIEELQEMKQEYILNETSEKIGQKSVSWGELADMQARAESRWNETKEGRELTMLEAGADEVTIELYKALKAVTASLHEAISLTDGNKAYNRRWQREHYRAAVILHSIERGEL